jgi:YVTN family beta-propeller protein
MSSPRVTQSSRLLPLVVLAAAMLIGSAATLAADSAGALLLVLEKSSNSLVIVDPDARAVVARVPVGNDPHEVVASQDGRVAYISNYERGSGHTIARVDLVNRQALPPIELGALGAPHGLAFSGGRLYFTAEAAKTVARWDPATEKVDWAMGTGKDRTHMVLVSRDQGTVFTSDDGSATVSFIKQQATAAAARPGAGEGRAPGAAWTIDTVTVGPRSEGFDLSPDGKELWIANANESTISVIDVATRTIVATLPSNKAVNRIRFSPDGKYVFVPDLRGTQLLVIDVATRAEYRRIELPGPAEGVVIAPDGRHAYVTLPSKDGIGIIDLTTMTAVGEIATGKGPDGLAWAPAR